MPKIKITPSKFAETFLNINSTRPFSFRGREYFRIIYDSSAKIELFKTARQSAKSTFLSNRIVTRASLYPKEILYVAPRNDQSRTFSAQKLNPVITLSPKLRQFLKITSTGVVDDKSVTFYRCFKIGSSVKLSTTFNGVDRDRGISIDDLYVDEVQDQLQDDIDVLSEGLSAAVSPYTAYAGTPKSKGNYIEKLWQDSKQIVWMIKCAGCNEWQFPNIEDNIRESGLLCKKCEKKLNVLNGQWVSLNSKGKFNGWHISQLMRLVKGLPGGLDWKTDEGIYGIWDKFSRFTPEKFNNEVLGLSFDSALNPLTFEQLKDASFLSLYKQEKFDSTFFIRPIVMGVDWGAGNNNYTVISVSMIYNDKPTVIYMKRIEGVEADPVMTAEIILDIWKKFECTDMYCDDGMFFHFEKPMRDVFGNKIFQDKIKFIKYYQNDTKLITKAKLQANNRQLFMVSRNDIMNLYVHSIKQKKVGFFNFDQFIEEKFHNDYLAIGYEIRHSKDRGERLFFLSSRDSSSPTDAFHSGLYSWLGIMMASNKLKWYYQDEKKVEVSY